MTVDAKAAKYQQKKPSAAKVKRPFIELHLNDGKDQTPDKVDLRVLER
jgi:hypothetical protein